MDTTSPIKPETLNTEMEPEQGAGSSAPQLVREHAPSVRSTRARPTSIPALAQHPHHVPHLIPTELTPHHHQLQTRRPAGRTSSPFHRLPRLPAINLLKRNDR